MKTTQIDNSADVLDSRDIIKRIEELEAEIETAESDEQTAGALDEEKAELALLKAVAEEGEDNSPDWKYGSTLIRESYFTEYAEQMLEDVGDLPRNLPTYIVIDWEATADNLRVDYTEVNFGDVTYLIR